MDTRVEMATTPKRKKSTVSPISIWPNQDLLPKLDERASDGRGAAFWRIVDRFATLAGTFQMELDAKWVPFLKEVLPGLSGFQIANLPQWIADRATGKDVPDVEDLISEIVKLDLWERICLVDWVERQG